MVALQQMSGDHWSQQTSSSGDHGYLNKHMATMIQSGKEKIVVMLIKRQNLNPSLYQDMKSGPLHESQMCYTPIHHPNFHSYRATCYIKDTLLPASTLNVGIGHKLGGVRIVQYGHNSKVHTDSEIEPVALTDWRMDTLDLLGNDFNS